MFDFTEKGAILVLEYKKVLEMDRLRRYKFDVKLTGFETVSVIAASEQEAAQQAEDRFWALYTNHPAVHLRSKTLELDYLGSESDK